MLLTFTLNGRAVAREIDPSDSLLQVLRDAGCYSVRGACETTNCGICAVWVDEKPVLSCAYPAPKAEGHKVTTLEGVRSEAEEVMNVLAEEGADQCGFCSPGFIMTVLAMLKELDDPTEEEIKKYLAGNLCRCTGYMSQMRALKKLYEKRNQTRE